MVCFFPPAKLALILALLLIKELFFYDYVGLLIKIEIQSAILYQCKIKKLLSNPVVLDSLGAY